LAGKGAYVAEGKNKLSRKESLGGRREKLNLAGNVA
jgi:hypothetical protein